MCCEDMTTPRCRGSSSEAALASTRTGNNDTPSLSKTSPSSGKRPSLLVDYTKNKAATNNIQLEGILGGSINNNSNSNRRPSASLRDVPESTVISPSAARNTRRMTSRREHTNSQLEEEELPFPSPDHRRRMRSLREDEQDNDDSEVSFEVDQIMEIASPTPAGGTARTTGDHSKSLSDISSCLKPASSPTPAGRSGRNAKLLQASNRMYQSMSNLSNPGKMDDAGICFSLRRRSPPKEDDDSKDNNRRNLMTRAKTYDERTSTSSNERMHRSLSNLMEIDLPLTPGNTKKDKVVRSFRSPRLLQRHSSTSRLMNEKNTASLVNVRRSSTDEVTRTPEQNKRSLLLRHASVTCLMENNSTPISLSPGNGPQQTDKPEQQKTPKRSSKLFRHPSMNSVMENAAEGKFSLSPARRNSTTNTGVQNNGNRRDNLLGSSINTIKKNSDPLRRSSEHMPSRRVTRTSNSTTPLMNDSSDYAHRLMTSRRSSNGSSGNNSSRRANATSIAAKMELLRSSRRSNESIPTSNNMELSSMSDHHVRHRGGGSTTRTALAAFAAAAPPLTSTGRSRRSTGTDNLMGSGSSHSFFASHKKSTTDTAAAVARTGRMITSSSTTTTTTTNSSGVRNMGMQTQTSRRSLLQRTASANLGSKKSFELDGSSKTTTNTAAAAARTGRMVTRSSSVRNMGMQKQTSRRGLLQRTASANLGSKKSFELDDSSHFVTGSRIRRISINCP